MVLFNECAMQKYQLITYESWIDFIQLLYKEFLFLQHEVEQKNFSTIYVAINLQTFLKLVNFYHDLI